MDEKEKEFNKKVEIAFNIIERKYKNKFKFDNPFLDGVHNSEVHHKLLEEWETVLTKITNETFNKNERDLALKLAREKGREYLVKINKLRGL